MQNVIEKLMAIDGVTAAAVVNAANGMTLVKAGGMVNLDIAGAACTELLRAAVKTMKVVGNAQPIEDLLLVAGNQYHLIQPITARPNHFVYTPPTSQSEIPLDQ